MMTQQGNLPLVYPYAVANVSAQIKNTPDDFRVTEMLGFEPSGSGEHLFLYVQKVGLTSHQLIEQICSDVGLHPRNAGYSGLKDKHAITRQWISLHLPGMKEIPDLPDSTQYRVLQAHWHDKKLRVGVHRSNRFVVTLRNIRGDVAALRQTVSEIEHHGFANYFGEQRFGARQDNVSRALSVLNNRHKHKRLSRHKKSLYLSALRSELFNQILSARVARGHWLHPLDGDTFMLSGSQSLFSESVDNDIRQRYASFDIHSVVSLYGSGDQRLKGDALALENAVFSAHPNICETLLSSDIKRAYRPVRALAKDLQIDVDLEQDAISVSVELSKGVYLTTLLDHLLHLTA